jgi:dihydrofolate reductase
MRNLIYAINLTLDGCCDHTKFKPPADDEVLEHYSHLLRDFDLLVYGRKTYQLMVPYWPDIARSQSETKADIGLETDCYSRATEKVFASGLSAARAHFPNIAVSAIPRFRRAERASAAGYRRCVENDDSHRY